MISKAFAYAAVVALTVATASTPAALAAPLAYVPIWCWSCGNGFGEWEPVSVIDLANNRIVATVPTGWGGYPIAANGAGTRVMFIDWRDDPYLSIVDTANNTIAARVRIPYGDMQEVAVNAAGTRAYVSASDSPGHQPHDDSLNIVSVVDLTTNTVVASVPFGPYWPGAIAVDRSGTRVYVAAIGQSEGTSDELWVIDAATNAVVNRIAVPRGLGKIAMDATGTRLYVADANSLSIIDTATDAFVATRAMGDAPTAVVVNPAGTRVYVATSDSLLTLAATLDIIATIPIGPVWQPAVATDPTGARVYVTGPSGVAVVDTATNTIAATIPVPGAYGIAVSAAVPGGFDLNRRSLTGSWYQPATNGQGVELEVYEDLVAPGTGYLQGAWFTYDYKAAGGAASQRWYTFGGVVPTGQSSATLTLYQNVGGNFNALPVTSAVPVGNVVLTRVDCNHITMAYTFTDGSRRSGSMAMVNMTPTTACSDSSAGATSADFGYSGNWFDSGTSGQGLVLDANYGDWGPLIFAAWYTYAPNGQAQGEAGQRWYTALGYYGGPLPTGTVSMDLYETTGGLFDKAAPAPSTAWIGTSILTFTNCNAATLSFNFTGGSSAGASGAINLSRVGPAPASCGR